MREILQNNGVCIFGVCPLSGLQLRGVKSAARMPKGAKSAIVCLFPYGSPEAFSGNLAAYCAVKDYHNVAGEMLEACAAEMRNLYKGEAFEVFVDTGPVPEVRAAAIAGLGVIGSNGLLIAPVYGSYVFIGEIVTTMPPKEVKAALAREGGIQPPEGDLPQQAGNTAGTKWAGAENAAKSIKGCLNCGLCIKACPGGAILPGGQVKEEKCASYLSQKKGVLTNEQKAIIKSSGKVFGCDICQEVCPMNRGAATGMGVFLKDVQHTITKQLITEGEKRAYSWRGRAVLLRNLELFENDR